MQDRSRRIHMVACSMDSDDFDTDDYERVARLAVRVQTYARKLGFNVMYEGVDHPEVGD